MSIDMYSFFKSKVSGWPYEFAYIFLMNIIVIPLVFFWTLFGIVTFPIAFILMRYVLKYSTEALTRKCVWIYGRVWQLILCLFVSFRKEGLEKEKFEKPCIIVVNHRSFFDTYCMNMLPISTICFAVRSWPFRIYIYTLFMKLAEYLNIEDTPWDQIIELSKKILESGHSIVFFPEGHRSRDGNLTHFYSGAFRLAFEFNAPVIPICLTGTRTLLPPGRLWMMPTKVVMRGLDPVYPDQFQCDMPHIELKKYVKNQIQANIKEMEDVDLKW